MSPHCPCSFSLSFASCSRRTMIPYNMTAPHSHSSRLDFRSRCCCHSNMYCAAGICELDGQCVIDWGIWDSGISRLSRSDRWNAWLPTRLGVHCANFLDICIGWPGKFHDAECRLDRQSKQWPGHCGKIMKGLFALVGLLCQQSPFTTELCGGDWHVGGSHSG